MSTTARSRSSRLSSPSSTRASISSASTTHTATYGARMFAPLREQYPQLRAFDRGEARHAAVAAASIVAKDERDRRFAAIAARYRAEFGELAGGGYLNPPTRAFLDEHQRRYGRLPAEARRTWTRGHSGAT